MAVTKQFGQAEVVLGENLIVVSVIPARDCRSVSSDAPCMIHLRIQEDLEPAWRPVIERAVNCSLGPVQTRLRHVRIQFVGVLRPAGVGRGYRCVLIGRGVGGETYHTEADNSDGRVAIQDALLRARRSIARRQVSSRW